MLEGYSSLESNSILIKRKKQKGNFQIKHNCVGVKNTFIGEKRMSGCSVPPGEKEGLELSGMGLRNTRSVLLTLRVRESPFDCGSERSWVSGSLPTAPPPKPPTAEGHVEQEDGGSTSRLSDPSKSPLASGNLCVAVHCRAQPLSLASAGRQAVLGLGVRCRT